MIKNRYKIVKEIGQGGMGIIYLVQDTLKDNMPFALKTIKQDLIKKLKNLSLESFKNEYEIMTRLKHPNLTRVYDFGEFHDNYYIVMEYLQGNLLSENRTGDLLDIIIQILWALEYIHSRNIIYGDIKPSNILIIKDKVKLLDFGLSETTEKTDDRIKGSLTYMPPEGLDGHVSFSSDIFSLGLTFYELLTQQAFYLSEVDSFQSFMSLLKDKNNFEEYTDYQGIQRN